MFFSFLSSCRIKINLITTETQPVKNGWASRDCNLDRLAYLAESSGKGAFKSDVRNNKPFQLVAKFFSALAEVRW
jgi:hypothetical protein